MPLHICACVVITSFFVLAGGITLLVISAKSKHKLLGVLLGILLILCSIWMMLSSGRQMLKHISSTSVATVTQPQEVFR